VSKIFENFDELVAHYELEFNEKNNRWNKEIHHVVDTIFVESDKGGFQKNEGKRGFYQTVHKGYRVGPVYRKYCKFCSRNLEKLKKEKTSRVQGFCSEKCQRTWNNLNQYLKKSGMKEYVVTWEPMYAHQKMKSGNIEQIKIKDRIQRKDMLVHKNGKAKPLTKKSRTIQPFHNL